MNSPRSPFDTELLAFFFFFTPAFHQLSPTWSKDSSVIRSGTYTFFIANFHNWKKMKEGWIICYFFLHKETGQGFIFQWFAIFSIESSYFLGKTIIICAISVFLIVIMPALQMFQYSLILKKFGEIAYLFWVHVKYLVPIHQFQACCLKIAVKEHSNFN